MYGSALEAFAVLARDTYCRIDAGEKHGIQQSEETITELNLLEIARRNYSFVRLVKPTKIEEAKTGIDWEIWIGSDEDGWRRYAMQAKRLSLSSGKYASFRQKNKHTGLFQLDVLEAYAIASNSIPVYCFYNYVPFAEGNKYWHCNMAVDVQYLGCTVVPLEIAKVSHAQRRPRTFGDLHQHNEAKPWHCLFCPLEIYRAKQAAMALRSDSSRAAQAGYYSALPSGLLEGVDLDPPVVEGRNGAVQLRPRAIMVVNAFAEA